MTAANNLAGGEQITVNFSADGYITKQLQITIGSADRFLRFPADMVNIQEQSGGVRTTVSVSITDSDTIPTATSATVTITGQNLAGLSFPQFDIDSMVLLTTLRDDGLEILVGLDNVYTGNRDVTVMLSAPGYTPATMTLRIMDASTDTPPRITVPPRLVVPAGSSQTFDISIDSARTSTLNVIVTAGEGITVSPAVLEFKPGETIVTATVSSLADGPYEPYSVSSILFDIPGSLEVAVVIEGQFNAVEDNTDTNFGKSISLSSNGQVMAVGTISGMGRVDVYIKDDAGYWVEMQTLEASNADLGDEFGSAIAISNDGNTIAISAPTEDSTMTGTIIGTVIPDADPPELSDNNAGAVYIFTRADGEAEWRQQTYIKASNASVGANFGVSVTLSEAGDILAVGADQEAKGNPDLPSGAVYVFTYETDWSEAHYLKLTDGNSAPEFGASVSLSGDGTTLAVGSPNSSYLRRQTASEPGGAVYVFTTNSNWGADLQDPVAIHTGLNRQDDNIAIIQYPADSRAGGSVGLNRDGTTLVIGKEDGETRVPGDFISETGAVDIYTKEGNFWLYRQEIQALNAEFSDGSSDSFGASVAINAFGTVLAIGAPAEDSDTRGIYGSGDTSFNNDNLTDAGAVYVYTLNLKDDLSGSEYQHFLSVKPGVEPREELGYGTAVSLSSGEGERASLAIGAAGLFEIIPYGTRISPDLAIIAEDVTAPIGNTTFEVGVSRATPDVPVEIQLFLEGDSATISTNRLVFTSTMSQTIMVEGVALGETKLTLVAITKDNAFSPLTKEITITITADEIITIAPRTSTLTEGSTQTVDLRPGTKANVSDTTITVTVENVGEGLRVTPLSLEFFNSTDKQSLTVEALTDPIYRGDRPVTFNLRATGGFVDIVTVTIIEDQLRPIGLDVGSTNLSLSSRTPSTVIEISVNNVVTDDVLRVVAEGTAIGFNSYGFRLEPNARTRDYSNLEEDTAIRLAIYVYEPGEGTITFMATGDRADTETVTVQVTVTESSFIIDAVDELIVNTDEDTTDLNINISLSESENRDNRDIGVTLAVEYLTGEKTDLVNVSHMDLPVIGGLISDTVPFDGRVNVPLSLTRVPGEEGNTRIRVTVTPLTLQYQSLYQETFKDITVRVNLPPIELSVDPSSLKFILGTTETVTVGVNADARAANARIEITQDPSDIVLIENNFADSGEITVTGLSVGETVLTIEANAFDYATETTQVSVTVQSPLFIVAPATFDLEEGSTQAINVGLSRIAEDGGSVTVMIEPEEGSELELTVSPSSLTFVTTELQQVIVTSINDDDEYTDARNAMLTLTADGYTTATVTANITDDEPQPIGLDVTGSTNLSLVRFTNTDDRQ